MQRNGSHPPACRAGTKGEGKTVPPRPSHIPNHYERSALTKLASGHELGLSKLLVGHKTIGKLLEKGWIERAGSAYRITEGGKAALRAKVQ